MELQRSRLGIAIVVAVPLVAALASEFPICLSAGAFGVPCPGCGLTRAASAALRGDFARAFALHPLVFVAVPSYVGFVAYSLWRYLKKAPAVSLPDHAPSRWVSAGGLLLIVFLLGIWGARFFDALGGPVPVSTYKEWAEAHVHP